MGKLSLRKVYRSVQVIEYVSLILLYFLDPQDSSLDDWGPLFMKTWAFSLFLFSDDCIIIIKEIIILK